MAVVCTPILDFGVIRNLILARGAGKVKACRDVKKRITIKGSGRGAGGKGERKRTKDNLSCRKQAWMGWDKGQTVRHMHTRRHVHTRDSVVRDLPLRGHMPVAAVIEERLTVSHARWLGLGQVDVRPY